jgi:hypothetical protein
MLGTDMKVAGPPEGLKDYQVHPTRNGEKEGVKFTKVLFPSLKVELATWERKEAKARSSHRQPPHANDCHVVEIKPGSKSGRAPCTSLRSTCSGRGATTIWHDEKRKSSFEWTAGSLFSIPLNTWYQNFNGSGNEPARYIAVTNAPPMMRLFADNEFIFNCDYMFSGRYAGEEDYYSGKGKLFNRRIWESNFIANAPDMLLYGWKERGAGGVNAMLEMANNNTKSHISEFPVGTYKKGHRHGPGAHLVLLSGTAGYSLVWTKQDRSDMVKCDWQVGSMVVVPSDNCTHQHFNSGTTRARYLALRPGDMGLRTPKGGGGEGADRSMKDGGWQIEYEDEDREIHSIFEKELRTNGATCKMKAFVPWCTGEVGPTSERDT